MLKTTSPIISIGAHGERMAFDPTLTRPALCGHDAPYSPGPSRRYCPACTPTRPCHICGTDMTGTHASRYCSPGCRRQHAANLKPPSLPPTKCELPECGITFTPHYTHQRCCTQLHGHRLYNRESRADGRQKAAPWNDRRKEQYHRRRALRRAGTDAGNPVVFADIAARDHWTCGICHKKVNPKLTYPHPMSASLDHILPLNAGGQHDPANTRLVHGLCNTRRGARYDGDAIMLFS